MRRSGVRFISPAPSQPNMPRYRIGSVVFLTRSVYGLSVSEPAPDHKPCTFARSQQSWKELSGPRKTHSVSTSASCIENGKMFFQKLAK